MTTTQANQITSEYRALVLAAVEDLEGQLRAMDRCEIHWILEMERYEKDFAEDGVDYCKARLSKVRASIKTAENGRRALLDSLVPA